MDDSPKDAAMPNACLLMRHSDGMCHRLAASRLVSNVDVLTDTCPGNIIEQCFWYVPSTEEMREVHSTSNAHQPHFPLCAGHGITSNA